MRPPIHNPTKPHCFLTQRTSNPEASRTNVSEETLCTWQPWLARTAPGPPQESLVRDETRISLAAKPSLTRTTLGQLCIAPRTSRSQPATTEPGREPRVSGGTTSTAMKTQVFLNQAHYTCFGVIVPGGKVKSVKKSEGAAVVSQIPTGKGHQICLIFHSLFVIL